MYVVVELTFVFDGGNGVDDTMLTDFSVRLDYCALHDDGVGGYGCIFRKNSERMDCGKTNGHLFAIISYPTSVMILNVTIHLKECIYPA